MTTLHLKNFLSINHELKKYSLWYRDYLWFYRINSRFHSLFILCFCHSNTSSMNCLFVFCVSYELTMCNHFLFCLFQSLGLWNTDIRELHEATWWLHYYDKVLFVVGYPRSKFSWVQNFRYHIFLCIEYAILTFREQLILIGKCLDIGGSLLLKANWNIGFRSFEGFQKQFGSWRYY